MPEKVVYYADPKQHEKGSSYKTLQIFLLRKVLHIQEVDKLILKSRIRPRLRSIVAENRHIRLSGERSSFEVSVAECPAELPDAQLKFRLLPQTTKIFMIQI